MCYFFNVSNIETTMNDSVLGDLLSNTFVAMEPEDVRTVAASYLMFKIGNIPVVINFIAVSRKREW